MDFLIRKNSRYLDVTVRHGSTVIELGLLDSRECFALARILEEAVDELTSLLEDDEVTP